MAAAAVRGRVGRGSRAGAGRAAWCDRPGSGAGRGGRRPGRRGAAPGAVPGHPHGDRGRRRVWVRIGPLAARRQRRPPSRSRPPSTKRSCMPTRPALGRRESRPSSRSPRPARRSSHPRSIAALSALNESDARLAAVAEQLAQLGAASRSAAAEAHRLDEAGTAAEQARDRDVAGLADLEERLRLAEMEPDVDGETALAAPRCAAGRGGRGARYGA